MKNIYILPTVEKSNLFKNLDNTLEVKESSLGNRFEVNQFMYITVDEKISLNNSVYDKHRNVVLQAVDKDNVDFFNLTPSRYKKIVLSNDSSIDVQQVSNSFLSFYAENQPDYVEVEKMLQVRHGVDWYDLPNQKEGRERDGIYRTIYSLVFAPKKDKFAEDTEKWVKKQSDKYEKWAERNSVDYSKLLSEFETMEGITSNMFDEKDWARFDRFAEIRAKENKTEEKLYTKEDLENAHQQGAMFAYGRKEATRTDRIEHFNKWLEQYNF